MRTAHTIRDASDEATPQGNRPLIRIRAGQMPETIDEAEGALLGSGLGFYQRGSIVVRPAMVPVAISGGKQIDAPRLVHVKGYRRTEALRERQADRRPVPNLPAFHREGRA